MARLGLVQFSTDKAFQTALKMHVYNTLNETVFRAVMGGNTAPLSGHLHIEIGRFTARKINYLFVPDGPRASSSAEFFGYTSHKVREKLTQLADHDLVEMVGRGLRDAQTYKWKAPVEKWELCSFMRFRQATGADLPLNLENHRVFESFADQPFTVADFIEMYRLVHESEYERSRWGKRKFDAIRGSYAYDAFLKGRLQLMHKHKLVHFDTASARFQLTPAAMDAAQHFLLFAEGPGYVASWDMCFRCPMNRLCNEVAVTDLILDTLRHGNGGNGKNGANGAGGGSGANGSAANGGDVTLNHGKNGAHGEPLPEE